MSATALRARCLHVGELETPHAGPGEVRVRLATSGVNPSDVKSRQGTTRKMAFPLVIPTAMVPASVDEVGAGVPKSRVGERVWVWNGQWKRAFGTAAEFIVVPSSQAVPLPAQCRLRSRRLSWNSRDDGYPRCHPCQCVR